MSTSVPASPPTVRFGALRGRVPLPWGFVAGVAVTLAMANAFIIVAVQGAIGAIERAQSPFTSWLHYSAMVVPVFALAVTWALARAHHRGRRTPTTVLLVAAASAAVGIVALVISTAYDYHLQSQLLARSSSLHSTHVIGASGAANSAYDDGAWSPEQRDTLLTDVKGAILGSVLLIGINLVLVAWITALRGGRLDVLRRRADQPRSAATPS